MLCQKGPCKALSRRAFHAQLCLDSVIRCRLYSFGLDEAVNTQFVQLDLHLIFNAELAVCWDLPRTQTVFISFSASVETVFILSQSEAIWSEPIDVLHVLRWCEIRRSQVTEDSESFPTVAIFLVTNSRLIDRFDCRSPDIQDFRVLLCFHRCDRFKPPINRPVSL